MLRGLCYDDDFCYDFVTTFVTMTTFVRQLLFVTKIGAQLECVCASFFTHQFWLTWLIAKSLKPLQFPFFRPFSLVKNIAQWQISRIPCQKTLLSNQILLRLEFSRWIFWGFFWVHDNLLPLFFSSSPPFLPLSCLTPPISSEEGVRFREAGTLLVNFMSYGIAYI